MRPSPKYLLLPSLLAALALTACGSSSSGQSSSSAASQSTTAPASAAVVVKTASNPTLHATVLTDASGMTLYHLSGEQGGKFICTSSGCLSVWHPVIATGASTAGSAVSSLGTVTRSDGTVQLTYKGTPLYTFAEDRQPGQANGQGLKDVGTWTAVTVSAPASAGASTTTTSSTEGGYHY